MERRLTPASHMAEPVKVLEGWKFSDLDESELVDDDFIVNDPANDLGARPVVDD